MDVIELLKRHEGLELKAYCDMVGKITIGYGRNLTDRGINQAEAEALLTNDVVAITQSLGREQWFIDLDQVRQAVLIDVAFNVGLTGLMAFHRMLDCVRDGDYISAAAELRNSKAARMLPGRYGELADMMNKGRWPLR